MSPRRLIHAVPVLGPILGLVLGLAVGAAAGPARAADDAADGGMAAAAGPKVPYPWTQEFPKADWSRVAIDPAEVMTGGPTRDGIPAIDAPVFRAAKDIRRGQIRDREPVIGVVAGGEAKAYPLSVMIWHEVVNDTIGGVPVAVTYGPLTNAAVVFERTLGEGTLNFGVTGRLRHSALIMYDRETESWWEQMSGEAVSGVHMGEALAVLPSRLESFGDFKARAGGDALVMIPADPGKRNYGTNPYWGYDRSARPMLYDGAMPEGIAPLARVVAVGDRAWSLDLLKEKGVIEDGDLVITYAEGQVSALDAPDIANSRPIGGAIVQRRAADGSLADVAHTVPFAFAFHAHHPAAPIATE